MHFFPKFPEDKYLSEQVRLIQENFIPGHFGFLSMSAMAAIIIYIQISSMEPLIWLACVFILGITSLFRYRFRHKVRNNNPRQKATIGVISVLIYGLMWGYLSLRFIPDASPTVLITISIISSALTAGSVSMHASSLPTFIGFTYPNVLALSLGFFLRSDPVYAAFGIGCIVFLTAATWFAMTTEASVRASIDLRFENNALIKDLRAALNETDEANRAKSMFLASASHDLRQPLHALGLLTETMATTNMSDKQAELQAYMMSAVDSTRSMLDSLLNISRLEAGAIVPVTKPFLIEPLLRKLEDEFTQTTDPQGLIYRTKGSIAAIDSDPLIVELILRNLIANAIRYTKKGGVLVACRDRRPDHLVIEIWDTGIGIDSDAGETIFKEFQQLRNPERDGKKGFGLGLSIAQGLAKTLNSKITFNSIKGRGSVFRVQLPKSNAAIIEDLPAHFRPSRFDGLTALIIDDHKRIRDIMKTLMQTWGFEVISEESAEHAITALGKNSADVMLVDFRLRENRTGRDAIEELRAHLEYEVPAIIITGDTDAKRISEAQSVAALLLHKPASTIQLQRMLQRLLK
ncbi:MAG: signal transduction histidine kinase/CheY-like chemotaxis protein [Chitinophagales bacterium]|jgi:signal transduction histidine kinase/CheY-like chemotaxis protein